MDWTARIISLPAVSYMVWRGEPAGKQRGSSEAGAIPSLHRLLPASGRTNQCCRADPQPSRSAGHVWGSLLPVLTWQRFAAS